MPTVLVAGASGLVGHAAIKQFSSMPGWDVIGVSRRTPHDLGAATLLSVDLLDEVACDHAFSGLSSVTHLVYAALQEDPGLLPGWTDPAVIERNDRMLRNLFEPLSRAAGGLQHVSLLHGTKAYGIHHPTIGMRDIHIPLREREPRREHPNFYFLQEDYLRTRQRNASWAMTVFRPTVIYGDAAGNNMNPILAIAAYAALLREQGRPLDFPGSEASPVLREAVDARLVARALAWAATSDAARNETYNLTNGDVFLWKNAWPAIAQALGMEAGEHHPMSLVEELPRHDAEWAAIVDKYHLDAPRSIVEFVGYNSLVYTDVMLGGGRSQTLPALNSTIKARQHGFHDCIDTEDMFRELFSSLRAARKFPA
jgi:nucleoside-diphosphate-sugar epimerase